jgi:hypothetical protein
MLVFGAAHAALHNEELSLFGFPHHMEKQMTKVSILSAALIAAAAFSTQAIAAGSGGWARHATATARASVKDCVWAPDVGAYASDPYTVPPCESNTGF